MIYEIRENKKGLAVLRVYLCTTIKIYTTDSGCVDGITIQYKTAILTIL